MSGLVNATGGARGWRHKAWMPRAAIFWYLAGLYQRGHHDELGSPRGRRL